MSLKPSQINVILHVYKPSCYSYL